MNKQADVIVSMYDEKITEIRMPKIKGNINRNKGREFQKFMAFFS